MRPTSPVLWELGEGNFPRLPDTRPSRAGQSRRVGGRGARDLGARQRTRKAIEARWWKKGRRRRSTAAAVRIQSECALTYMNASSGQNLSAVRTAHDERGCARRSKRAAHSTGVTKMVRLRRTNVTCIWGVSDPLTGCKRGTYDLGLAEGVAHAPDASLTAAYNCADCDTGGKTAPPDWTV